MITFAILDIFVLLVLGTGFAFSAFLLASKYHFFQYYNKLRDQKKWLPNICLFCIGFWVCLFFTIAFSWYVSDPHEIHWFNCVVASICASGFIRYLNYNFIL